MTKVALLDYGMGNLHSAGKALSAVGANVVITRDPQQIKTADKIMFPGVGAMRDCMAEMHATGVADAIKTAVFNKPVMAICVGMQALFEHSAENNGVDCLGILDGDVIRFDENNNSEGHPTKDPLKFPLKVPHMGWNTIMGMDVTHPLWRGIADNTHFYFVHSFYCVPSDASIVAAHCHYGQDFCASVLKDNLFATQFHPEKSHTAGLQLLKNFVEWRI